MFGNALTLTVELVVLCSEQLGGLAGAVVSARGLAGTTDGHAGGAAGENTTSEHIEWRFQQLGGGGAGGRGVVWSVDGRGLMEELELLDDGSGHARELPMAHGRQWVFGRFALLR